MKPIPILAGVTGTLLVLSVFVFPALACACSRATPAKACLQNLRLTGMGLLMYAEDHDDRFPQRDVWRDSIAPYVKETRASRDPEAPKGAYGYAFNAILPNSKAPLKADKVPMVYDSVNPIRNASDFVTSLPPNGRHKGENNIAYADGHAKRVKP